MERGQDLRVLSVRAGKLLACIALLSQNFACTSDKNTSDDEKTHEFSGQGAALECETVKLIKLTGNPSYIFVSANDGFTIRRVDVRVVNTGEVSKDLAPLLERGGKVDTERYPYTPPDAAAQLQTTIYARGQHKECREIDNLHDN